jgi:hypothetical protein
MIPIAFNANRVPYIVMTIPVPKPEGSNGLTDKPVKIKTTGVRSKHMTPAQILFFLSCPVTFIIVKSVKARTVIIIMNNRNKTPQSDKTHPSSSY